MSASRHFLLQASEVPSTLDGVRCFVCTLPKELSLDGEAPKTWVTVTKIGTFFDPRYGEFEITRPMLLQMLDNFSKNTYGQEIFLDVAHEPSNGAAAKFIKLAIEGNKLRALLAWTPYGIEAIKVRGFRYLSADYYDNYVDNEQRAQHGALLRGAGLTIRPAIKFIDPVQLSEPDGSPPTILHPDLQNTLLQEIQAMWKELLKQLSEKLSAMKLSAEMIKPLTDAAEKSLSSTTEKTNAEAIIAQFEAAGKTLSEQIAGGAKDIKLSIDLTQPGKQLSEEDILRILATRDQTAAATAKKLAEDKAANVKLLSDIINSSNAAKELGDEYKKRMIEEVLHFITPELSENEVKKLAEIQIKHGKDLAIARQLSGKGFSFPVGTV
ncbi:MAG: phage protease, partial [Methylotenera sp.]|nr:phage protease [Methylotenera sp.]